MRHRKVVIAVALACAALVGFSAFYLLQGGSEFPSPSCAALSVTWVNLPVQQSGGSYVCGRSTVTDGYVKVSLGSYKFVDGSTIDWTCPSNVNGSSCSNSGTFLLANVTIDNVGGGNFSIGPEFFAQLNDSSGNLVVNQEFGAEATFPGQYPSEAMPAVNYGTLVHPHSGGTYWLIFYLPNVAMGDVPYLKLRALSLFVPDYGGDWMGPGSFACGPVACQNPNDVLIVLP